MLHWRKLGGREDVGRQAGGIGSSLGLVQGEGGGEEGVELLLPQGDRQSAVQ